jgi:long-chain fatty acid transport protein
MQRIARVAVTIFTLSTSVAHATGLRVPIENGLGTPGVAAGPALAEDASTGITNPAGLVRINDYPEFVLAVNPAFTSTNFKGDVAVEPPPIVTPIGDITTSTYMTGEADAKLNVPLLAIHLSYPLKEWLVYGFSLTNPFGQSVDYPEYAIVAPRVTEATLITWDISNSFGFQITPEFSVGVGIDAILLDFSAENLYPFALNNKPLTSIFTQNEAAGWSMSWHAGALYQFNNKHSRVGFNYRPPVTMEGDGRSYSTIDQESLLAGTGGGAVVNKDFEVKFDLPPIYSLAIYHQIMPRLDIALSTEFTQWSYFDEIQFKNVVNTPDFNSPQGYKNTWGYGASAFYQWTQQFRTSVGLKFDYSPLNPKYITPDFPDSDVWVLGVSGAYQFNRVVRLEIGYSHSFFQEVEINTYDPVAYTSITGTGHLYGDVINTQLTINLAPLVKRYDNFNEYVSPPGKPEWPKTDPLSKPSAEANQTEANSAEEKQAAEESTEEKPTA